MDELKKQIQSYIPMSQFLILRGYSVRMNKPIATILAELVQKFIEEKVKNVPTGDEVS